MTTRMKFTHVIPAWRLDPTYLARVLYARNYSTATLLVSRGIMPRSEPAAKNRPAELLRKIKAKWFPPTPERNCWAALAKGYQDGLAGLPFDERYRA
jgi:hypothetical protein